MRYCCNVTSIFDPRAACNEECSAQLWLQGHGFAVASSSCFAGTFTPSPSLSQAAEASENCCSASSPEMWATVCTTVPYPSIPVYTRTYPSIPMHDNVCMPMRYHAWAPIGLLNCHNGSKLPPASMGMDVGKEKEMDGSVSLHGTPFSISFHL